MTVESKPKSVIHSKPFSFVGKTGYFLIAGVFIQCLTAMLLLGFQMLLEKAGVECPVAFAIVFLGAFIAAFIIPNLFIRYFTKVDFTKVDMSRRLILFNFAELTCIQGGLSLFFSDPNTLCYVSDGQNGMEIFFAGVIALPILILLSWRFDTLHKKHLIERNKLISESNLP
jgi:hypothetical protein